MMLKLLIVAAVAAGPVKSDFQRVDFAKGGHQLVAVQHGTIASFPGSGDLDTAALPKSGPALPIRGSKFSTLFRARDVVDVGKSPARAVAKLFRLTAKGDRSATGCTAQFIGPRHLLTAGHCIVDRMKGVPHPGFEVAAGFDDGAAPADSLFKVIRAWVPADQWILRDPTDALVTPDKCSDYAVVEVDRATKSGWLGMRNLPAGAMLYRFSYPHRSSNEGLPALASDADPENVKFIENERAKTLTGEPEFSPRNLFFDYGAADIAEASHFASRPNHSIPGQSGSALLDESAAIVAIMSRNYEATTYNCRFTTAEIGAIAALVSGTGSR